MKTTTIGHELKAQKQTEFSKSAVLRLGLMLLVALCALMLQGADRPGTPPGSQLSETAASLCEELAPDMRPEMKKLAAQNPVWVLQLLAE